MKCHISIPEHPFSVPSIVSVISFQSNICRQSAEDGHSLKPECGFCHMCDYLHQLLRIVYQVGPSSHSCAGQGSFCLLYYGKYKYQLAQTRGRKIN